MNGFGDRHDISRFVFFEANTVLAKRVRIETQEAKAILERGGRWAELDAWGQWIEQHRQPLGLLTKNLVEHGEQSIVVAGAKFRVPLGKAVMFQRPAAVCFLLQDDRVNQLAGFHAAQRQEPVGPGVRRFADELGDGLGTLDSRFLAQFQVGINDLAGLTIFLGQMPKFIDGNGHPVAAHPDRGQPLLQITRLPFAAAVVAPFEQVPQLQRNGLQGFLEFWLPLAQFHVEPFGQ